MAIVTSTVATVVSVIATMKLVYITAQHRAENHSARPPRRMSCHSPAPRIASSATSSAAALKALRQNVTSKLRAASSWRVTTPAMLHSRVQSTIRRTARRWVIDTTAAGRSSARRRRRSEGSAQSRNRR